MLAVSRAYLGAVALASLPPGADSDTPLLMSLQIYLRGMGVAASIEDLQHLLGEDLEARRQALRALQINLSSDLLQLLIEKNFRIDEFLGQLQRDLAA